MSGFSLLIAIRFTSQALSRLARIRAPSCSAPRHNPRFFPLSPVFHVCDLLLWFHRRICAIMWLLKLRLYDPSDGCCRKFIIELRWLYTAPTRTGFAGDIHVVITIWHRRFLVSRFLIKTEIGWVFSFSVTDDESKNTPHLVLSYMKRLVDSNKGG